MFLSCKKYKDERIALKKRFVDGIVCPTRSKVTRVSPARVCSVSFGSAALFALHAAYSMLIFANVCIQHQIGAYLMLIRSFCQCLYSTPNCCIYAARSLLGGYLMLIRCLFVLMFGFEAKLPHICSKILTWCLIDA